MIINGLLTLLLWFLRLLLLPLKVIPLPEGVETVLVQGIGYLKDGFKILGAYVHLPYLLSLFSFVLTLDLVILGYKAIMWIIKKIPFFGVK